MLQNMSILQDKYALTAIAAILIVAAVCLTDAAPEPPSDTDITGIVSDVRKTQNGYTFILTDGAGTPTKCFYSEEVPNGIVCSVTGRFSDDGSILFASRLVVR